MEAWPTQTLDYPRKGGEGLGGNSLALELCDPLFIQLVVLSTYCVQAPAKAFYRNGYFIDLSIYVQCQGLLCLI